MSLQDSQGSGLQVEERSSTVIAQIFVESLNWKTADSNVVPFAFLFCPEKFVL